MDHGPGPETFYLKAVNGPARRTAPFVSPQHSGVLDNDNDSEAGHVQSLNPFRTCVLPDPYAPDGAVEPEYMSDGRGAPEVDQSVNHELDWLRDVYRMVDPRFNRVTREGLERALTGLDMAHLSFVRDLNSVILKDQLEIIGGCPESYEQISLYTDYIIVDNFLTHLMGEAGTNAVEVTPEMPLCRRPSRAHADLDCGFTWDSGRHTVEDASQINKNRRLEHFASGLWRRSSIRRPLKILFAIFVLAFVEQGLERFAPEPLREWTRHMRQEAVTWLAESFSMPVGSDQR